MAKINLVIYEGAMCCSTGVCGPEPNKGLIELNEALKTLQNEFKELNAVRASISFNLDMFLKNSEISKLIQVNGPGVLPITTINGKIIAQKKYLKYEELRKALENVGREEK